MIDVDRPDWMRRGICNTGDAVLLGIFFPRSNQRSADDRAKQVCAKCPVAGECLDYALDLPENPHGVWGGLSAVERRPMRRERHGGLGLNRPIEHGAPSGYQAHLRRGEDPCFACADAHRVNQQFVRPSRSRNEVFA